MTSNRFMTEADWLAGTDPRPMLHRVRLRLGDRRLRLFAAACCRLVWDVLPGDWCRHAVEQGEQYADGLLDESEREAVYRNLNNQLASLSGSAGRLGQAAAELLRPLFSPALVAERARTGTDAHLLPVRQCDLLRDIAGNPFRLVRLDPAWQTAEVERLARAIHEERGFGRVPELAGPLRQAGCTDEGVLGHCLTTGTHVRGCWLLDLLIGN
jgi:hypothetical protein